MVEINASLPNIRPAEAEAGTSSPGKLTLLPLTALVVGSMIGGGVFNLPSDMSRSASPGAVIIGWIITGIGMLMLAFVYQGLATKRPDLNAGPYAYAKAGFGNFVGFNSAWGYWISAFLGNVAYAVAIFSALSYFAPLFGDGNNIISIVGASLALWAIHFLVLGGVKEAAFINVLTTIGKLVPLAIFVVIAIFAFNFERFTANFWGAADPANGAAGLNGVLHQVKSTMLVTLWVFIGIEGASVYSARAARRADIGRATVAGFSGALVLYVLVSLLPTGILTQPELAALKVPSMAGVMQTIVGHWGAALISLGLVISVGGAFLSWTLLCAEIPYSCGKDGTFPRWFAVENGNGAPVNALWMTNAAIQLFLLLTYFSKDAYNFFYFIASVAILPPYVFSGAFALKLALADDGAKSGSSGRRTRDIAIGGLATIYGLWLVYAAGLQFLLMATLLFLPGILVFVIARREQGAHLFEKAEWVIAGIIVLLAAVAAILIATGKISPL